MKKFFCIAIVLISFLSENRAQDYIFMTNDKIVKANVLEINELEVRYILFDFQDGPIYVLTRKSVDRIEYRNGNIEHFNSKRLNVNKPLQIEKPDTVFHRLIFGGGGILGIFNPSEFYDYVNSYANYRNLKVESSFDNVNFGARTFVGYRITRKFDLNISGEISTSIKNAYNSYNDGNSFSFDKFSAGITANRRFLLNRNASFCISGSVMFNNITIKTTKETLYSGNSLGYKIQAGLYLFETKSISAQGLIGGEYANAKDKGLQMDYSGFVLTLNLIFNK